MPHQPTVVVYWVRAVNRIAIFVVGRILSVVVALKLLCLELVLYCSLVSTMTGSGVCRSQSSLHLLNFVEPENINGEQVTLVRS